MVATSSLGCQHLSQRNASANAETKPGRSPVRASVGPGKRPHQTQSKSRGRREEGRGGGGGRNVFGMKDSRLERRLAV